MLQMNMKDLNFCLFGGGGLVKVMVFIIMHFQQDFRYFVIVSFTGGGNQSTRRKLPTCSKTLTNLIT